MTVYISPNPGKEQAADTARRAAQLLLMQEAVVLMRDDLKESCYVEGVQYLPLEECLPRTDVILTIGGDGTTLRIAKKAAFYDKCVLGINGGRLGFMSGLEANELSLLGNVVTGKYKVDKRMMLQADIIRENQATETFHCLNDAVVTRGDYARLIDVNIHCEERPVWDVRADR